MAQEAENIIINDDLLSKYFSGEASPEEAMAIDEWKSGNENNRQEFLASLNTWNQTTPHPYRSVNVQTAWNELQPLPKRQTAKRVVMLKWAIAASILICIAIPAALLFKGKNNTSQQNTITASLNKTEQLLLPDGSSATIPAGSSLTYPTAFTGKERNVALKGHGSFDIKTIADQPFIVTVGPVKIKVLGTSFHVSDVDTAVTVEVSSGKILMYTGDQQLIVSAGETGTYLKKEKKLGQELLSHTFHFDNDNLDVVSAALSKAYRKKIIVRDPDIATLKISANFEDQSLDYILEVITTTLNITYTSNLTNNEIYFEKAN